MIVVVTLSLLGVINLTLISVSVFNERYIMQYG